MCRLKHLYSQPLEGKRVGAPTCAELSTVMVMVMVTNRIDLESILD